jgi:hypothetical protein
MRISEKKKLYTGEFVDTRVQQACTDSKGVLDIGKPDSKERVKLRSSYSELLRNE